MERINISEEFRKNSFLGWCLNVLLAHKAGRGGPVDRIERDPSDDACYVEVEIVLNGTTVSAEALFSRLEDEFDHQAHRAARRMMRGALGDLESAVIHATERLEEIMEKLEEP